LREIGREIERALGRGLKEMRCDQRNGLGSLYSEMDGPDQPITIVSNGWDEDLERFGIKYRISGDSVHESVSAEKSIDRFLSRSIYFNSVSIDLLFTL
jgi:hypothetical protein